MSVPSPAAAPTGRSRLEPARLVSMLAPLVGVIFVWILFAALAGGDFMRWENQRLILLQSAVVGTAAIGATLIIIAGGIDLSVGSTIALGTVVIALLLRSGFSATVAAGGGVAVAILAGVAIGAMVIGHVGRVAAVVAGGLVAVGTWTTLSPLPALLLGALACGAALGLNEWALGRVKVASFIVTLGMWGALRGLAKGLGGNQPVYPDDTGWLDGLMHASASGLGAWLPPGVIVMLVLAAVMAAVLRYTRFGRHVVAVGSSRETARLTGIHVERTQLLVFALGIGCAGVASMLQLSYLSMGDPTTAQGYELKVIAAVVIGGASLSGGEGSIRGTILGALLMTMVDNGCTKLGLDNWVQEIVTGGIIVAAVVLDQLRHRRAA
jgi:ribose/xylose/arabinose/galactoside ABC-type transport system permease subunit